MTATVINNMDLKNLLIFLLSFHFLLGIQSWWKRRKVFILSSSKILLSLLEINKIFISENVARQQYSKRY